MSTVRVVCLSSKSTTPPAQPSTPIPEAPVCLTPETIGPCVVVGGGGYIITEGVKSIVNAWAGEEAGNDEGEAELHAKEVERESECGKIPTGSKQPRAAYRDLEQEGLSRGELSDALHKLKRAASVPNDANTRIDSDGNVYDEETGEDIGNIIDEAHG